MSTFAEKIRVLTLKSQAERAMSAALDQATELRSYLDAEMAPPEALIDRFLAGYEHAERLYLEFLLAQDAASEQIEVRFHGERDPLYLDGDDR